MKVLCNENENILKYELYCEGGSTVDLMYVRDETNFQRRTNSIDCWNGVT